MIFSGPTPWITLDLTIFVPPMGAVVPPVPVVSTGTLAAPIDLEIEREETFGDSGVQKQVTHSVLVFEEDTARHHEIGFRSNLMSESTWEDEIAFETVETGWGDNWGNNWGGPEGNLQTPLRVAIPRDHARCQTLRIFYRHRTALEKVSLLQQSLWFEPYSSRIGRRV